jgi:hypothetical protein
LAFFYPYWSHRDSRLLQPTETLFVVVFSIVFFVFCSMNQYGYMQFNTGVRHIVPVTPFIFLLVASVLRKLPVMTTALVSAGGVYWSWCLAMYRDVEQGLGVFEAVIRITLEGFQIPWLTTLSRMGYIERNASALPLLFVTAVFLTLLWRVKSDSIPTGLKWGDSRQGLSS